MRYELSWTAPEGKAAKADLNGVVVDGNEPVVCSTWWDAALLAAKIVYDNEALTDRVVKTAEQVASRTPVDMEPVEVGGWVFSIRDEQLTA